MSPAMAQELRIATSYKLLTLDPHYATLNENTSLLSQIYERLIYQDETLQLKPGLATSWRRLSETQWEFKLRANVLFHDGTSFTSQDVAYSIERIRTFLNPPGGGFQFYTKDIKSVSSPDPLTVLIDTNGSAPALPLALSSIFIMEHAPSGFRTTEELNAGTAPVGTGPYKFARWQSGEELKLVRNDDYWGGRPAWAAVTFRIIESPQARVAALRTGDVDLADFLPARDVAGLRKQGVKIASIGAARVNFLQFDMKSDHAPGVTDKAGQPIANPFKDVRVRRALSMATDRSVLSDKVLSGFGASASQFFPDGLPGTSSNLSAGKPDYEAAKALLAQAGYPDGFAIVLAGPTGRYPGDAESLQAITQNWARVGVTVRPVAAPFSVFNTKRAAGEYGLWYAGASGETVDVVMDAVLATEDVRRGTGIQNYGHYSNPEFDGLLAKAEAMDFGTDRDAALARATEFVMADQPIIPLYHFDHIIGYGARVGSYLMHPRGWTTAMQAVPAGE
ncbi:ABC transporter substrate-binding protein [Rhizobium calliandrae]|uniref:ABC transporter substrate-binding protein n=1 Tax=Rhizobium calliandrae TaxID=1312182 RepID=A0ABT7KL08_9HYPH|nr:ABC transporter substrate-binding protein [Rhizobium calliandrae]MDL2408648.1 ABC transporter substrate-binding protein [Rhizobium calliandrae]